jgi:hypothetical protein
MFCQFDLLTFKLHILPSETPTVKAESIRSGDRLIRLEKTLNGEKWNNRPHFYSRVVVDLMRADRQSLGVPWIHFRI